MNEHALVRWFVDLYESRTGTDNVLDAHSDYRVTWHEIWAKMNALGYSRGIDDGCLFWKRIFEFHGLEKQIRKIEREAEKETK